MLTVALSTTIALSVAPPSVERADLLELARLDCRFEPGAAAAPSPGMLQDASPSSAMTSFGADGSRRWTIQGSYGDNLEGAEFGMFGAGISWFVVENLSINVELNGYYTSQPVQDTGGGNFNLLFRWHFMARETWSLFIDGGVGLLLTDDDVPHDATSYNFTPQAGTGLSFDAGDTNRAMIGVRWHHISNANLDNRNPGRDSLQVWAGLSMPF